MLEAMISERGQIEGPSKVVSGHSDTGSGGGLMRYGSGVTRHIC